MNNFININSKTEKTDQFLKTTNLQKFDQDEIDI